MQPMIHVHQSSELIDAQIHIKVTNLHKNERLTMKAQMRDNLGMMWKSFAQFISDEIGEVDLEKQAPISGTYEGIDAMGLFWSMVPNYDESKTEPTPLQPLETQITVESGGGIATTTITLLTIQSNIQQTAVREAGVVGTFFSHRSDKPLPSILVLGGSEGRLKHAHAALLASYGFHTLAIAYFGFEHLPNELVEIPLETVERALTWLKNNPMVDASKIGIQGISKGGELALLSASAFSDIKAVVAYVPSNVVYPGIGASVRGMSSWTYNDKPLPFAYETIPTEVQNEVNERRKNGEPIAWRKIYEHWANCARHAEIPIEQSDAAILLLSGGDDQLWPSDLLSENVIKRLQQANYGRPFQHICYEKAGHAIGVPGFPTTLSCIANGLILGGTPKDNAAAQYAGMNEVKRFFTTQLLKDY